MKIELIYPFTFVIDASPARPRCPFPSFRLRLRRPHRPDGTAPSPSSKEPSSSFSLRRWPEEAPLPSVPEWKRWRDGLAPPARTPEKAGPRLPEGASPYGCLISTLDPTAEPHPYRYTDVYVHYPDSVVAAAGDSIQTLTLAYGSHTLFAETPREEPIVVRVARCRLPGLEEARAPLIERLGRFERGKLGDRPCTGQRRYGRGRGRVAAGEQRGRRGKPRPVRWDVYLDL